MFDVSLARLEGAIVDLTLRVRRMLHAECEIYDE
jgi:hypothetical protein